MNKEDLFLNLPKLEKRIQDVLIYQPPEMQLYMLMLKVRDYLEEYTVDRRENDSDYSQTKL